MYKSYIVYIHRITCSYMRIVIMHVILCNGAEKVYVI